MSARSGSSTSRGRVAVLRLLFHLGYRHDHGRQKRPHHQSFRRSPPRAHRQKKYWLRQHSLDLLEPSGWRRWLRRVGTAQGWVDAALHRTLRCEMRDPKLLGQIRRPSTGRVREVLRQLPQDRPLHRVVHVRPHDCATTAQPSGMSDATALLLGRREVTLFGFAASSSGLDEPLRCL